MDQGPCKKCAHVKMRKLLHNCMGIVLLQANAAKTPGGSRGISPQEASCNKVDFDFYRIYRSQIMKCFKNLPRLQ